jgi:5-methylcytosine-specific restriction protein A
MAWASFKCGRAIEATREARASGRFKSKRSKIGIRADGSQLVRLWGVDWEEFRVQVFERDGWRCVDCKVSIRWGEWLDPSHDLPRGKGGGDTLDNVHCRCRTCHNKRDHRDLQFGKGKQA